MGTRFTVLALVGLGLGAMPALAVEEEFLPGGSLRYTLTQGDFSYESYPDFDSASGWLRRGHCVINNNAISQLRSTLSLLNQKVASNASGDELGQAAANAGDNLKHCRQNGESTSLLQTAPVVFVGKGRIEVRVTYSVAGVYAATPADLSAIESQKVFAANIAMETESSDGDIGGTSESISVIQSLEDLDDLSPSTVGSGFGRTIRRIQKTRTSPSHFFETEDVTDVRLHFRKKAYGVDLRIERVELTFTAHN